jgi:hypothetical protein
MRSIYIIIIFMLVYVDTIMYVDMIVNPVEYQYKL